MATVASTVMPVGCLLASHPITTLSHTHHYQPKNMPKSPKCPCREQSKVLRSELLVCVCVCTCCASAPPSIARAVVGWWLREVFASWSCFPPFFSCIDPTTYRHTGMRTRLGHWLDKEKMKWVRCCCVERACMERVSGSQPLISHSHTHTSFFFLCPPH